MEQSTPLEASEHFVPLPESLDEEHSENSIQQDKSHPKTKWWGTLESLGNGPGLEPQLTCLSAGGLSAVRQESIPISCLLPGKAVTEYMRKHVVHSKALTTMRGNYHFHLGSHYSLETMTGPHDFSLNQ